jgi:hypothetical protein
MNITIFWAETTCGSDRTGRFGETCLHFIKFSKKGKQKATKSSGKPKTTNKQTNSMVRVRERTIPTERPPLVGEVIANFCG